MSKKVSSDTVADSDVSWVALMNNKEFYHSIAQFVIGETKNVIYGGSVIIGFANDDLKTLIDEYTIDLVIYRKIRRYKWKFLQDHTKQGVFKTLSDWMKHTNSDRDSRFVLYFFGDAHNTDKKSEYTEVHWNCYILDTVEKKLVVYDPSDQEDKKSEDVYVYNFNPHKKQAIQQAICDHWNITLKSPVNARSRKPLKTKKEQYTLVQVYTKERAQQVCEFGHPSIDFFCQTWVLLFASAYINGVFDYYKQIPFEIVQNFPLKMWANCVISRLEEWKETLSLPEYRLFQSYCRMERDGVGICYKLPKIIKQPCSNKPCIVSVITYFLKLDECVV